MAKTKVEKEEVQKEKRIENFLETMEKRYGKGVIAKSSEGAKYHPFISTGSIGLDKAIGIGGLPRGRITEIFGPESSGKTTVAMHVIAEAHKDPESVCGFVDVEHAYDRTYADSLGIDPDRCIRATPDFGEQALEIVRGMVESGDYDVVVVDSVAALVPFAEMSEESEIGDARPALQARMMSQALRILTPLVAKSNCVLIFINQLRDKPQIGGGGKPGMPVPQVTSGGNALKFYASVRLDVRRNYSTGDSGGAVMEDKEIVGNLTKVKVIKNKVAPPFKTCEFNIIYGEGIDKFSEILRAAVECDVIKRSGSWYSYGDTKIGQGFESVKEFIRDNEELFLEIRRKVEETFIPKDFVPSADDLKENE